MPAAAARRGGVKVARSPRRGRGGCRASMLGKTLVTHQTGPEGREVKRVYVEEGCDIARELYLGCRSTARTGRIAIIGARPRAAWRSRRSPRTTPEKIIASAIDPATGLSPFHARRIAFGLGPDGRRRSQQLVEFCRRLYRAFTELDASLVEINPLVVTGDGRA